MTGTVTESLSMPHRLLHALLLLTSLFGYLEWGEDRRMFLFQVEWEVIARALEAPLAVLHPLVVLPLAGQLLLLVNLLRDRPVRPRTDRSTPDA